MARHSLSLIVEAPTPPWSPEASTFTQAQAHRAIDVDPANPSRMGELLAEALSRAGSQAARDAFEVQVEREGLGFSALLRFVKRRMDTDELDPILEQTLRLIELSGISLFGPETVNLAADQATSPSAAAPQALVARSSILDEISPVPPSPRRGGALGEGSTRDEETQLKAPRM
jgi:hypothetical protein